VNKAAQQLGRQNNNPTGETTMSKTNSNPKTAKHTPGPWTINPPATCNATSPRTVHHVQFEEPLGQRNEICVMVDASFESDANARLIAAAPTLLADLEAAQKREQVLRDELTRLRDVVSAVEHDAIDAALES
jgi:hypothetical protein